ncbi:sulfotransferase family protein [Mucilaginibacter aquariorum]|uniref:Sulfotransferase n=1 Tax=Mucilaginibacter aquariorum TaxID=2967225 RepID=A0ABT1SVN2_9SPHI|nr:sulfotransferase [Mucilaginibacter aquariorum]MCQ6956395.1 sulfotransferase [Mucilaginibacter aquariorum]
MKVSGIQIIGTQRSGSNLLRVILDQSPELASPHPPHVLVTFYPLLNLYGALENNENYYRLVTDVVSYVAANPVPWEGVTLTPQDLFNRSAVNSLFELNRLIYEKAAESKGAKYWCCKSMNNVYYAGELEAQTDKLKYIYLYRDGRDVAASFKKAIVGDKHIYHIATQWKKDQEASLALARSIPSGRFFSLSYERLIGNPEETVRSLCDFLQIAYNSNMLNYYTSKTSKVTAASGEMWSNLEKPIMTTNTGKYLKEFQEDDLEIFELVAGNVLLELGYQLQTDRSNKQLIAEDNLLEYFKENHRLKQAVIKSARPLDIENRMGQEAILKDIKNRKV